MRMSREEAIFVDLHMKVSSTRAGLPAFAGSGFCPQMFMPSFLSEQGKSSSSQGQVLNYDW